MEDSLNRSHSSVTQFDTASSVIEDGAAFRGKSTNQNLQIK
jgi:hypothetical protein